MYAIISEFKILYQHCCYKNKQFSKLKVESHLEAVPVSLPSIN